MSSNAYLQKIFETLLFDDIYTLLSDLGVQYISTNCTSFGALFHTFDSKRDGDHYDVKNLK